MSKYALLVDHKLCFGCKSCEIACKQTNDLPVGPRWIQVITVGPIKVGEGLKVDFVPMTCHHCAKPPCIDACPTGAIIKRADGIVTIDNELCNGCMACIPACFFTILQYNPDKNVIEKCNMCLDRIEKGMKPACVQVCPSKAIYFGETNNIIRQMQEQRMDQVI
ncbi:MAG: 4Fe-4S dicluster domain-containing protein [Chloroflexi bacterium]|nr:4Fe-4S dicluster domain-containing protein [Chloroflexota bacterium]